MYQYILDYTIKYGLAVYDEREGQERIEFNHPITIKDLEEFEHKIISEHWLNRPYEATAKVTNVIPLGVCGKVN